MIESVTAAVEARVVREVAHRQLIAGQCDTVDPQQTIAAAQGELVGQLIGTRDADFSNECGVVVTASGR